MRFLSGDPKRTMGTFEAKIKGFVKPLLTFHYPNDLKNIFLFGTPRGGSTWIMELLQTQPGYKIENEPFDLRNKLVRDYTGITEWSELYKHEAEEKIKPYIELKCRGKLPLVQHTPGVGLHYLHRRIRRFGQRPLEQDDLRNQGVPGCCFCGFWCQRDHRSDLRHDCRICRREGG